MGKRENGRVGGRKRGIRRGRWEKRKGTREGGDRKEETRGDLEWVDGVKVGELMLSSRWRERDSG